MLNAHRLFAANLKDANSLGGIYRHLLQSGIPGDFDDLLRSQLMYSVSAFDKLIHDLIKLGMSDIYAGRRPATAKYLSESLTLEQMTSLNRASAPPKEILFEQFVIAKLKILSFQEPNKLADGLAFIWLEDQKWQKLSAQMAALGHPDARTELRLIADRRNSIVHQADIDPVSGGKLPISEKEAADATTFILNLGTSIFNLVK